MRAAAAAVPDCVHMGRMGWLFVAAMVLLFLTSVRVHFLPGQFGEHISIDFVAPWR